MRLEITLCGHLAEAGPGARSFETVHALVWQDGPIDAIARCRECGAHALVSLVDWAPPRFALRVYSVAGVADRDVALYMRNAERGSCDVSRAAAELEALWACAGPPARLIAVDVRRDAIVASCEAPPEPFAAQRGWPERLPSPTDSRWFAALGLSKIAAPLPDTVEPLRMKIEIVDADLSDARDAAALVALLDAYAREPIGGATPLAPEVSARLAPDLRARIDSGAAVVLCARSEGAPVGIAVCFVGDSTFQARPLLNLHDLAVLPDARGLGVGQALLSALEARARALGCCKVTLEVREDNARARRLYEQVGYVDYSPGGERTRTLFLEKKL